MDEACEFLKRINYYRFKVYLRPFLDQPNNLYRPGATFEQGVDLYRFDDELRDLCFTIIGRLEVKIRSRLDQTISAHTNNPFWYLVDSNFNDRLKMEEIAQKISSDFKCSSDDFTNYFKAKYYNNANSKFKHLPPFWIAAELLTFGTILRLFKSVKKSTIAGKNVNKMDALAREFGAKNLKVFNGWLAAMRDVRNRCAHHSRLWNCNYREPAEIRKMLDPNCLPPRQNRIYLILVALHIMCKSMDIQADIRDRLQSLIGNHPAVTPYLGSIGFHMDWALDPVWN